MADDPVDARNYEDRMGFQVRERLDRRPLVGLIFHHVEVEDRLRGKGIGKELLRIRLEAAREVGYKMVLATVKHTNDVESTLLKCAGFEFISAYFNSKNEIVDLRRKLL